jgi:hypothetical protein
MIAPSHPLAPATPLHTRLAPESIRSGMNEAAFQEAWRGFLRDDDLVIGWGNYAASLLVERGAFLPPDYVDLRGFTTRFLGRKLGALESFAATLGADVTPTASGRGTDRMQLVVAILRHLRSLASTG